MGVGLSVLAAWLAVRNVDLATVVGILGHVSPGPLAIVAGALVVQLLVRSARWSQLLPVRLHGRVPTLRLAPVVLIGYLGNTVLPARLGDPARALLAGRRETIPASGALGSVVVERAMDTLTLALLVFPAAGLSGAPDWLVRGAGVAAALAATVLIAAQTRLSRLAVNRFRGIVPGRRASLWADRADAFFGAMDSAGRHRAFLIAIGLSILAWLLDATIYWATAWSLGIDLAPAGAMLVCTITVLGTAIPSAPGYVGTFELAASTTAIGLGVPPATALALAILVHTVTALPLALGGVAALAWIGARFGDLTGPMAGDPLAALDPSPVVVEAPGP